MHIEAFYDSFTFTLTYIVHDETTKQAAIIDPVLNYEPHGSVISQESVNEAVKYIKDNGLELKYILDTHAHADHLSGSQYIKKHFPKALVGIGKNITLVQETFKGIFNLKDLSADASQFDILLDEENSLELGELKIKTIFTPGHTPACSSILIDDALFTGDALFMPDFGTGRCDFPKGSAEDLYHSVHEKLYKLPDETRVFVGHDYQPGGRELKYETTIGESKKNNIQLKEETSKEEYIKFRTERDAVLNPPKLLLQSIQVNIDAGHLPQEEDNGVAYLKFPITNQ